MDDIFNWNWVATRWQFSTHTNNTGNVTKQTIQRTQKYIEHKKYTEQQLGRVRALPRLCGVYPGICLTTEEKARKNQSV